MVELFLDKIIDGETYHLVNFMDRNWNSTSTIDSYGHDIEASWLLYEAASLVNDPALLAEGKGSQPEDSRCCSGRNNA
jgi:cellobiose epimerase